MLKCSTN